MTNRIYLDRHHDLWVEATDDAIVVSWPHGHRALPYEVQVPDLLALLGLAIRDTYEPVPNATPRRFLFREPESSEPSS